MQTKTEILVAKWFHEKYGKGDSQPIAMCAGIKAGSFLVMYMPGTVSTTSQLAVCAQLLFFSLAHLHIAQQKLWRIQQTHTEVRIQRAVVIALQMRWAARHYVYAVIIASSSAFAVQ
jgi:hypothetical protein